jgi:hypothetical protein
MILLIVLAGVAVLTLFAVGLYKVIVDEDTTADKS